MWLDVFKDDKLSIFSFAHQGDGENSWITDKCEGPLPLLLPPPLDRTGVIHWPFITPVLYYTGPISHRPYITPALYYPGPILPRPYITPALYYTSPILHQPYLTMVLYNTGPYYTISTLHLSIHPTSAVLLGLAQHIGRLYWFCHMRHFQLTNK